MARAVRLHTGTGFVCAVLGEPGRKWTPYVSFGFPIRKRKIANSQIERYSKPLMKGKSPYPLKTACNKLLTMGKNGNITKGARQLLNDAKVAA